MKVQKKILFSLITTFAFVLLAETLLRAFKYTSSNWMKASTKSMIFKTNNSMELPSPAVNFSDGIFETDICPYYASFSNSGFRNVNIKSNNIHTKEMYFYSNVKDSADSRIAILGGELAFGRFNNDWETIGYFYSNFNEFKLQVDVRASLTMGIDEQIEELLKNWNDRPYKKIFVLLSDDILSQKIKSNFAPTPFQNTLIRVSSFAIFKLLINYFYKPQTLNAENLSQDITSNIVEKLIELKTTLNKKRFNNKNLHFYYLPHRNEFDGISSYKIPSAITPFVTKTLSIQNEDLFFQDVGLNTISRYGNIQISKFLLENDNEK